MTLIDRYLNLVNVDLPKVALSGAYPVRFNHCFARIVLDNLCGCHWKEVIAAPVYKNMTDEQLNGAIALAEAYLVDPELCRVHNQNSLQFRGKLK